MSDELLNLWPSRTVTPDAAYGDTSDRCRAFLYTRDDGTIRFVVLNAQGLIVAKTDVAEHQHNGAGVDITTADGQVWQVVPVAGCATCGGGSSAGRAFEMLRGQGEDDA